MLDEDTEGSFRRATFKWALSTKAMVESSRALTTATRVPPTALADIAYAREMLDRLFVPQTVRAGEHEREDAPMTADDIRNAVSGLASRILTLPVKSRSTRRPVDLTAPVYPTHGKSKWALHDCPECPSKATQRCQRADGGFMEKPHPARKALA